MSARPSIDSNILVYAALEPGSEKGLRAAQTIRLASEDGVLAVQALLEFVAVIRRRAPQLTQQAFAQAGAWAHIFRIAPTNDDTMRAARLMVERHHFQIWDAVIWSATQAAGATLFLSEDLQDGFALDGLRVVNPFRLSEPDLNALLL